LPTKTEQADLMLAMYGRHGESPLPIVSSSSPADCFDAAFEAVRIAVKYRTPVILLTDGYLANGAEPWALPDVDALPDISVEFTEKPNHGDDFWPYLRDPETLARPWAIPGTPGLQHRVGGIEKEDGTGNISYDPENHDHMVRTRAAKIQRVTVEIPPTEINGPESGDVLVVGWGGTFGAIRSAVERAQAEGVNVAAIHIRHISPLPPDLGAILKRYRKVLVPEINSGQLVKVLRAEYLCDAVGFNKVRGLPLLSDEIHAAIIERAGDQS
jgi:2-oxoglutarate ferredoxin oxidoreductase subunit alpha